MRLDRVDVANLRAAGLTVVELDGWLTRGRPGSHDPKGILCHHTAGEEDGLAYAKWMGTVGRPDLSAPLAQIGLDREGVVYMQAAGRANHAGRCKPVRSWLTTYPGLPYGDGNAQMIGVEAMNTGSEGWGPTQVHAYVTLCAVLAKRRGWDEEHVLGHKETSLEGKPDPSFDMGKHRAAIAAALQNGGADMAVTQEDAADLWGGYRIVKDVRAANPDTAPRVSPAALLEADTAASLAAAKALATLSVKVDAIAAKVGGIDVDETKLAQQLGALMAPVVGDVVRQAVAAGGEPEAVAQAVVDKLGAALAAKPGA